MNFFESTYYNLTRTLLCIIGIWPYQEFKTRMLRTIISYGVLCISTLALSAKFFTLKYDIDAIVDVLTFLVPNMCYLSGYITWQYNIKKIKIIFDWIKSDWAILQNPEEVNIIKKYAIKSKNITIFMIVIFYVFLFVIISTYTIPTLLDIVLPINETRRHKCPFPIETFYNIEDTTFGHILVTFVATTLGVIAVSVYSSFLLVIYHACGMLSITGYILEHAFLGNDQYVNTSKECEMIHKKIVRSVRVHIRAIKFFENIKDISEICYSVQIGLALILVAADYIKLMLLDKETLMKNMSNTIALFLHGIGILFSLFINCHAGQEVINHSTDVFHKATVAPWYLASKRTQKSAILILMRSQIPCYVGLLKTSMSCATVCYTIQ